MQMEYLHIKHVFRKPKITLFMDFLRTILLHRIAATLQTIRQLFWTFFRRFEFSEWGDMSFPNGFQDQTLIYGDFDSLNCEIFFANNS